MVGVGGDQVYMALYDVSFIRFGYQIGIVLRLKHLFDMEKGSFTKMPSACFIHVLHQ